MRDGDFAEMDAQWPMSFTDISRQPIYSELQII